MVSTLIYPGLEFHNQKRILHSVQLNMPYDPSDKIAEVMEHICKYYNITSTELKSQSRKRNLVQARAIFCHYLRTHTKKFLNQIGAMIGNRDHSTVLYCLRLYDELLEFDKPFQKTIQELNL